MKSILKIYRRYVCSACLLVVSLILINLAVFVVYLLKSNWDKAHSGEDSWRVRTGGYQQVADALTARPEGGYEMAEGGYAALQERGYCFLILLDGSGSVVWEWQKPEEVPDRFSAGEIGAFSKWYLKDYPVGVWRYGEEGLLVFGYPKGSVVRHNMIWQWEQLQMTIRYAGVFFAANGILVFVLALFFGYRFYRLLKPVGEGIDSLAEGRTVRMRETGTTRYLKEKINRTSELLEKQRRELARRDMARTEWIAGVSHDIRTPLSLIAGYADEMEKEAGLPEETRRRADLIRRQSFVIKKLIEDLNLTSRLTYHMKPLRKERYCPAELLRKTAAGMLNSGEIGENWELEVEVAPELGDSADDRGYGAFDASAEEPFGEQRPAQPGRMSDPAQGAENGKRILLLRGRRRARRSGERAQDRAGAGRENGSKGSAPHVMGLLVVAQIARAHSGKLWFSEDGREVWMSVEGGDK